MNETTPLWIIIALLAGIVIGMGWALWFLGIIIRAWLSSRDRGLRIE